MTGIALKLAGRVALAIVVVTLLGGPAFAGRDVHVRVVVPRASVHTGPGPAFRLLYRATRGEVLRAVDRNGDFWYRVVLPDGTLGWLQGDQVIAFEVNVDHRESVHSRRMRALVRTVFAPSPLPGARIGLAFSGGAIGGQGAFMFRPAVLLDSRFALEAHVGQALGPDGALLLYGLSGNVILWPPGPLVPFVSLGGGGATSLPRINGVTQSSRTQFALSAGGGLAVVFVKRIILRFDVRNHTLFAANTTDNRQEYSGGMQVFF